MIAIDLIIITGFLILTLVIGLYHGKGVTSFQDYAVGNKRMPTTVIILSLIATIYGGRTLHDNLNSLYHKGVGVCIKPLLSTIIHLVFARWLFVRMKEFTDHLSIAESMGYIYGSAVRMLTGLLGIMMTIGPLTVQMTIGHQMTTTLLPELAQWSTYSTLFLAIWIMCYATFGGMRAVAWTDVYQFLLFGLCMPILIFVLLYYAHSSVNWQKIIHMPYLQVDTMLAQHSTMLNALGSCICSAMLFFNPTYLQRFYMASSIPQAQKVISRSAIILFLLLIPCIVVVVILHITDHLIPPHKNVLHYIIELASFSGMRGILVTTIFALLMSTADSQIHAASVLFANDVWPMLTSSAKHKDLLKIVRITSIAITIISFCIVWYTTHHTRVMCMYKLSAIYTAAVTVPFIMASIGFRPYTTAMLVAIGINMIIAIYPISITKNQYMNVIAHYLLYTFVLLVVHYLLPKRPHSGWVGIKDSTIWDLQNQTTKRWWLKCWKQLKLPFTAACRAAIFPKEVKTFVLLGIYLIINAIIARCYIKNIYFFPSIYGYMAVMAMGTIIALYPALHSYKKEGTPLLHCLWPGLLFLLLFVVPIQFAQWGHFSPMVCALLICNLSLGIVLLSLEISIVMFSIALMIHTYVLPSAPCFNLFFSDYHMLELNLAIAIVVAAVVGLGTYKHLRDKAAATYKVMDLTRSYEHSIAVETIYHHANESRLDKVYVSQLLKEMDDIDKLRKLSYFLLKRTGAMARLEIDQKKVKTVAIEAVILKAYDAIRGLGSPMQLLIRNQTVIKELLADPALFECLFMLNLAELSKSNQAVDHIITLTMTDTRLRYNHTSISSSSSSVLSIPALAFAFSTDTNIQDILAVYDIKSAYMPAYIPTTVTQFYQVESRQITEAHGGYAQVTENEGKIDCLYVWPINGKQVIRFKTYDTANLTAGRIAETPESLAQEKALIELLSSQTTLTVEVIARTIAFIKKAHGLVTRKSGEPYYTHPMSVAQILLEATQDPDTLLAGLLHDVVEDTPITLNQIELMYGPKVAAIVDAVTHYNTYGYPWKLETEANKGLLYACSDINVVHVKLADRLHNIRTLYSRKPIDQQRIAKETLTFYIPWGERNQGPTQWLIEMKTICEEILQKGESH